MTYCPALLQDEQLIIQKQKHIVTLFGCDYDDYLVHTGYVLFNCDPLWNNFGHFGRNVASEEN